MESFTAKQAEFVTNNKNASLLLKKLNRENAFVFMRKETRRIEYITYFLTT
jgi:hypothetical protein